MELKAGGDLSRAYTGHKDQLADGKMIDWTNCPVVERNPLKLSGTPILKDSRMPADGIVENYRDGMTPEEIAEVFWLPLDSLRALLTFAVDRRPRLQRRNEQDSTLW